MKRIEGWLAGGSVSELACPDAYAAVLRLRVTPRPFLALVGLDGLPDAHQRLFSIFRQTWGGLPIVAYGAAGQPRTCAKPYRSFSASELHSLLALSPRELAAALLAERNSSAESTAAYTLAARGQAPHLPPSPGDPATGVHPGASSTIW